MSTTTTTFGPAREAKVLSDTTLDYVLAYLPDNYTAEVRPSQYDEGDSLWIFGHDVAGWTLDGYVLPRLASGNVFAKEVN